MRRLFFKSNCLLATVLLSFSGQALANGTEVNKGDANSDADVDISDVVTIVDRIYDASAVLNVANADVNGDGVIDISDVVGVVDIIYRGKVNATGTISGWTEGNENPETPLTLEGDEDEDESYGD